MKKARVLGSVLSFLLVSGIILSSTALSHAGSKAIELKFALYIPSTSAQYKAYQWFADELEKRSRGRVKVIRYPGQQLAKAKEMPEAVSTGLADIATISPTYTPSKTALHSIGHLPLLGPPRVDQQMMVLHKIIDHPAIVQERQKLNAVELWTLCGPMYEVMSTKPIRNLSDFKGLKIRTPGSLVTILKKLGAVPVFIPAPEIMMALSRGVVEAVAGCGDYFFKAYKVDSMSKYTTVGLHLGGGVANVFMNKKRYDALDEDIKEILMELRDEMPLICQLAMSAPDLLLKWYHDYIKQGIQFTYFPPKDREEIVRMNEPLQEEWLAMWEARGAREYYAAYLKAKEEVLKEYPNGIPVEYKH